MALLAWSSEAQHRLEHKGLMKLVEEFVARYERGERTLNVELMNFLRDWLTTHIQRSDRDYGPSVNKHSGAKIRSTL